MWEPLFAQTVEQSIAAWSQIVGAVGTTGFTGWLCWHLITKAIPDQVAKSDANMVQARKDFKEEMTLQRTHDAEENRKERESCESRHKELLAKVEANHQEFLKRLDSNHLLTREISHGVRDVLQARGMEKAAQELAQQQQQKKRQTKPQDLSNEDTTR